MAWWKTAYVGQKVVCVDDRWPEIDGLPHRTPMLNELLTIASINPGGDETHFAPGDAEEVYFSFAEIPECQESAVQRMRQIGWVAWKFRPLETRPTDISIFTDMLAPRPPAPVRGREDA